MFHVIWVAFGSLVNFLSDHTFDSSNTWHCTILTPAMIQKAPLTLTDREPILPFRCLDLDAWYGGVELPMVQ